MSNEEKERYYDQHIVPELFKIAKRCEVAGISLCAIAEWNPDHCGTIITEQPDSGITFQLARAAVKADGNIDALFIWAKQHAEKHGHSSMVLTILNREHEAGA